MLARSLWLRSMSRHWLTGEALQSGVVYTSATRSSAASWLAVPALASAPAAACTVKPTRFFLPACSLRRRGGLLGCLLAHPLHWAAAAVQELTKFAVIVSAITGESLRDSGRRSLDLLRRNALEAFVS